MKWPLPLVGGPRRAAGAFKTPSIATIWPERDREAAQAAAMHTQIAAVLAERAGSGELAVHHANVARARGIGVAELERNRDGYSADARLEAALRFAHAALITRGRVERREIAAMRRRGFHDDDLVELVTLAARVSHDSLLANFEGLVGNARLSAHLATVAEGCEEVP